jgi:hypothetical protein
MQMVVMCDFFDVLEARAQLDLIRRRFQALIGSSEHRSQEGCLRTIES